MTIDELIEVLRTFPATARVYFAGQYGWDEVGHVRFQRDGQPIADLPAHAVLISKKC